MSGSRESPVPRVAPLPTALHASLRCGLGLACDAPDQLPLALSASPRAAPPRETQRAHSHVTGLHNDNIHGAS